MSFLDRLPATRLAYGPGNDYWYERAGHDVAGVKVSSDTAMRLAAVQSAVHLIAGTVAKLPLPIYRRLPDGGRERWREHPLYDLLNYKPNEWQSAYEFRRMMTAHVALRGNAYALIREGRRGAVDQLIPWHPDCVQVEQLDDGRVVYDVAQRGGQKKRYGQDDVFHLRDLTLDGVRGLSRIQQAALSVGLGLSALQHGASAFANRARPEVALVTDKPLKDDIKRSALQLWNETYGGPLNAGKAAILSDGMKPFPITPTNEQAQLLEMLGFSVEDVARIFGIPPHLIGLTEKQTSWGTGVEQMSIGFLAFHMLDWFVMWETAIQRDLVLVPNVFFAEHLVDGLLRADFKTRMEGLKAAIESGQINPDEARRIENRNPREDGLGGKYWMPANFRYADEPAPAGVQAPTKSNGQSGHVAAAEVAA